MSLTGENPFGVLVATQDDEQALCELIGLLHTENGMFPLSDTKVTKVVRSATRGEGDDRYVIGLIKGDKRTLEGAIGLHLAQSYYSDFWHWVEIFLFVHPEHRRSKHAKRLVGFAKWCADEMGKRLREDGVQSECPLVIGIMTQEQLEPKMRLYQRSGLQQAGAWFMYPSPPPHSFNQRRVQ